MANSNEERRHSNCSGLDFVHSASNPIDPITAASAREFSTQARLTSATRGRYWQAQTLTLWQALALHCYLDPDILGAATPSRMAYLRQLAPLLNRADNLRSFCHGLDLIAPEVSNRPPLLQKRGNWFDSTTSAVPFRAHLQSLEFHVCEPIGAPYHLCIPEEFNWLHLTIEAWQRFWDTGERDFRGGPNNDEVAEFVRERGGSGALCSAIARVMRPEGARRGRPRKPSSMLLSEALNWKEFERWFNPTT